MGFPHKFDVIVVGAGPAGCSSAYLLAKAGLRVLLVERGRSAGSKLLWGGKAYAQPIREVWPELDKEAPIHRWVTRERFSFVWGDRVLTIEYKLGRSVAFTSYLPELVSWMARKAESAGALLVEDVRVDEIVVENGRVVGVRSGSDIVRADIVIDAEGVNRMLLEKLGLAERLNVNSSVALGVKETLSLDPRLMEERFNLDKGEGLAWLVAGDITRGLPGGGFIYTMRDSISIGLVIPIGPAARAAEEGTLKEHVSELIESFRLHPYFSRFWREADVIEYGGRMTLEGGLSMMPKRLYAPGLLVVGDAAGFLVNTGYTIRGVDTAVHGGKLAAETVIEALNKGGFTEDNLKSYEDKVKRSYIYRELKAHSAIEDVTRDPFYFTKIPQVLVKAAGKLFEADYEEPTLVGGLLEASRESEVSLMKMLFKLARVVRRL
ncbi:MAG: FAD-dependent oxidoreductase [Acidilobaceae archaeon]